MWPPMPPEWSASATEGLLAITSESRFTPETSTWPTYRRPLHDSMTGSCRHEHDGQCRDGPAGHQFQLAPIATHDAWCVDRCGSRDRPPCCRHGFLRGCGEIDQ